MDSGRAFSIDWLLGVITLALVGLGLLMVGSATANMGGADVAWRDLPVVRQAINAGVAMVGLVACSLVNYRFWRNWRWLLYGGMLAALAMLTVAGRILFGAQSWYNLGFFSLQPSELCKIVLIIVLASYLASHEKQVKQGSGLVLSLVISLPFLALVAAEPDLGTAAVLAAIWLGMLFLAGVKLRHIAILALAAAVVAPLAWSLVAPSVPHVRERIQLFLNPQSNPAKAYPIDQALISIGSGGLWGKGLGQGSQTQLAFLRVRQTDYIFSVLAEELGFVGSLLLLTLLAGLLLRIVRVSASAGDAYGRLIAGGVAVMVLVQVVINVGFNVGLLPVTGLPLPLISYGGSSLLTTLIGVGLVQSVALYHVPPESGPGTAD